MSQKYPILDSLRTKKSHGHILMVSKSVSVKEHFLQSRKRQKGWDGNKAI